MRVALREAGYLRHLQGGLSLGLHGQKIFQGWRCTKPRDRQGSRGEVRLWCRLRFRILDLWLGLLR